MDSNMNAKHYTLIINTIKREYLKKCPVPDKASENGHAVSLEKY